MVGGADVLQVAHHDIREGLLELLEQMLERGPVPVQLLCEKAVWSHFTIRDELETLERWGHVRFDPIRRVTAVRRGGRWSHAPERP